MAAFSFALTRSRYGYEMLAKLTAADQIETPLPDAYSHRQRSTNKTV